MSLSLTAKSKLETNIAASISGRNLSVVSVFATIAEPTPGVSMK
ncbi:MAG: hypothetical protein WA005_17480 [Candidatus Binataceae bacterium]